MKENLIFVNKYKYFILRKQKLSTCITHKHMQQRQKDRYECFDKNFRLKEIAFRASIESKTYMTYLHIHMEGFIHIQYIWVLLISSK